MYSWTRRGFLQGIGGTALAAATARCIGGEPTTRAPAQRFLREYGFWEYTTPRTGGFETYDLDDYRLTLDDMAQAGMNSIMIMVKWVTTGYRSKLPFLDQSPDNKVIASGNKLLRKVIAEANSRHIKVWLGAVTSYYDSDKFGSTPHCGDSGNAGMSVQGRML